jgi:pyruvate/2-oxoglutarate dehydrogenase complex dihydrolipoamide dehydrogenase (E3) component
MTNGSAEYDLIVVGAGPVGENVADRARAGGLSVAVVEEQLLGGECSFWACVPSKALLGPGLTLTHARSVDGVRQAVTGSLDVSAVFARRDRLAERDDSGDEAWLVGIGIDVYRGRGRLDGERAVVVDLSAGGSVRLTARHAVAVCTGTTATIPPIDGLASARPWISRDATSSSIVPESLVVLGGGVVATEMATAYAYLGSRVTVLARSGLLGGHEPFAGEMVTSSLRELGVDVRVGISPTRVSRDSGDVAVTLSDGSVVSAAEILVATGRTPATTGIGLPSVGLPDGGFLRVDETLRVVGHDWLYAVGDANGRALLTHQGKYQGRAAGDVIAARALGQAVDDDPWGKHVATADHAAVPAVVFSQPEVAGIGLTAEQARSRFTNVRVVDYDIGNLKGARLHADGYTGRARMVVDVDRHIIVGVTFVGPEVGELLHAATIAVVGKVPIPLLWHAVPSFPTMSEVWLRLLEAYGR